MAAAQPEKALKGFVGLALGALNVAVAVWVGLRFGWVDLGSSAYAWAVGGAGFVLTVKILIGALIGKDFTWCGNAYDSCVMAFGACMPALVISMAFTRGDLGTWAAFTALSFVSLLATGKAYQVIQSEGSPAASGFSGVVVTGLSLVLGFFNLGLYTLLAIEKVQQAGGGEMILFVALIFAAMAVPILAERKLYPDASLAMAFENQIRSTVADLIALWNTTLAVAKTSLAVVGCAFVFWFLYELWSRFF